MKIFLSALEASPEFDKIDKHIEQYNWNLMSYYYMRSTNRWKQILAKSKEILIDSGAHSFQKGKVVKWNEYTSEYANWIEHNDCDKIIGYFEMDIDPAGYKYSKVKELRKILTNKSNKIIPVWHKNRGIEDFKDMCKKPIHKDKIIAITGFKNEDIKDCDYINFVKYAHYYGCKVHCLGMTRRKILDSVPFDYVDSSSWKQKAIYGKAGKLKVTKEFSKAKRWEVMKYNYIEGMKMQIEYFIKTQVRKNPAIKK